MKVKAKRMFTLPDGGSYKKQNNINYPTKITYLDALGEGCWNLFKSYAELAGVSFCDDETNFYIAKEIQEKIISLIEENLKVGFPIIGTNENGIFCKITERVFIDTEWNFGIKASEANLDDITIAKILSKIRKGEISCYTNGVKWELGFDASDKNALICKEVCEMIESLAERNEFYGKHKGYHNIDYYIINGKKYSAVEILKADADISNPLRIAFGFKAALTDITT